MAAPLHRLAMGHNVLFFSGKGGVGKTTLAAATALAVAHSGRDVHLYSTDPAHNLGHLWHREVGPTLTPLWPSAHHRPEVGRVLGCELDANQLAGDHIDQVARTLRTAISPELRHHLDRYLTLVRTAPGTSESALAEKIAELCTQTHADGPLLIFDTAPTGHTARLMHLPETMTAYTTALLRRRQRADRLAAATAALGGKTEGANTELAAALARRKNLYASFRDLLQNPAHSAFVLVLTAERMPVAETISFAQELAQLRITTAALITNRRTPPSFAARAAMEERYAADLRNALPNIPLFALPLLAGEPTGITALQELAEILSAA
ncbi:MAG: ArsA family ATPase [Bowdeniella nasicola]|nr:ArsA family ATPase [Bowdeniella nasicola]